MHWEFYFLVTYIMTVSNKVALSLLLSVDRVMNG